MRKVLLLQRLTPRRKNKCHAKQMTGFYAAETTTTKKPLKTPKR